MDMDARSGITYTVNCTKWPYNSYIYKCLHKTIRENGGTKKQPLTSIFTLSYERQIF